MPCISIRGGLGISIIITQIEYINYLVSFYNKLRFIKPIRILYLIAVPNGTYMKIYIHTLKHTYIYKGRDSIHKDLVHGSTNINQQALPMVALSDDLSSIPSTHSVAQTICNSSSKGPNRVFWPVQVPNIHMVIYAGKIPYQKIYHQKN